MTTTATKTQKEINPATRSKWGVNFGVSDAKGREIGVAVETYTAEFVPFTPDPSKGGGYGYYTVAPGRYFHATVQMTRGNKRYGASQHSRQFATAAERDAHVAAAVENSRKNALKRYAS